ncbi:HD domain-containing protein [Micromonospora andamanensis]|uniref:HD domain-containing protein n=1 Tax=Micromonospora andamanensis TaxID=1287068 RepID=UPI001A3E69C2|nr:HD domain-containing protein [Micromonospora andamanensis]GIJ41171.1 cyanamide hydratase [Micromonospora andamanensis]
MTITPLSSRVPDTRLAAAATDLLVASSTATLVNHCLRTYQFGLAMADRDGLAPDLELLFIGAALHDLGFTERYDGPAPFEEISADAAHEFLVSQGAHRARADLVAEAIRLHVNAQTAKDPRPEVALLSIGAAVDVFGLRLDLIAPNVTRRIIEEYPRLGFTAAITAIVADQSARKPDSPLAQLDRAVGAQLLAAAPFAE